MSNEIICNQSFSRITSVPEKSRLNVGLQLMQKFSPNAQLGFFIAPMLFFLIPLKISLSVVIGCVVASIAAQSVFNYCSPALQELFSKYFTLYKNRIDSRFIEFIEHMRPFILWGMFLSGPLTLIMMGAGWLQRCTKKVVEQRTTASFQDNSIVSLRLLQNLPSYPREHAEDFVSSSFFTATAAAIFLSGIPAVATYAVYSLTGVDKIIGFPSENPQFTWIFVFILLYVYSVCWCFSSLFFKAYFTFPLNYTSTENAIELDETGIRTTHIKGWFAQVLFFCEQDYWPREMDWNSVRSVEYFQHGVGDMGTLSDSILVGGKALSFWNRCAAVSDAIVEKSRPARYVMVNQHALGEPHSGKSIKVNLRELDTDGRENLFQALKKWAPDAVISEEAHFHLTGRKSKVSHKHSELWFNSLLAQHGRRNLSLLEAGQSLQDGRFEVRNQIGTAGLANLYECVDGEGTVSILKEYVLTGSNGVDTLMDSATEFENECRILGQLSHCRIPVYRGMFVEDKRAYIVQEKVCAESLRSVVLKDGKFSAAQVIRLALQMCDLLEYLHGLTTPVIHRDFNPDNLAINDAGELFLVDFSIARQEGTPKTLVCGGRQAYCAPEQFRGEASVQSDFYAFGATLYFLLTAEEPPAITNLSLRAKDMNLPPELESIVARSTALEPHERYESATWIKLDLNEIRVESEQ